MRSPRCDDPRHGPYWWQRSRPPPPHPLVSLPQSLLIIPEIAEQENSVYGLLCLKDQARALRGDLDDDPELAIDEPGRLLWLAH